MPARRRTSRSSTRSASRSKGRRTTRGKRPLSKWNLAIKKAMAELKREGWDGNPKDRMRAAAKRAHEILGD
jgi:hypothetical protein